MLKGLLLISRDDSYWEEKEFIKIENTLSDAAEDGWTSNTSLHALAQLGRSVSCELHHSIMSVSLDTSSAAAKYLGSSEFLRE